MRGFITEQNFEEAETEFPGIVALYGALTVKPRTFLELLHVYLAEPRTSDARTAAASSLHDAA